MRDGVSFKGARGLVGKQTRTPSEPRQRKGGSVRGRPEEATGVWGRTDQCKWSRTKDPGRAGVRAECGVF